MMKITREEPIISKPPSKKKKKKKIWTWSHDQCLDLEDKKNKMAPTPRGRLVALPDIPFYLPPAPSIKFFESILIVFSGQYDHTMQESPTL